ncbi:MAG TPA: polyprenyl synthetase family protein [Streptosporangiaceae bacterium]|nr:polyprenyl synthetase family protein [Streptosporangiaceae bacterium]
MDDLDPATAGSLDDLAACLRRLHLCADKPTYRSLEQQTIHENGFLPGTRLKRARLTRSILSEMLLGRKFPGKAFLLTFVDTCGIDIESDRRWEQAWDRLAVHYQQAFPVPGELERIRQENEELRQELAALQQLAARKPAAGPARTEESVMESAIVRLAPDVRAVAAYHLGFVDAAGSPIGSNSGDELRPALVLLSARAAGAPPDRGVSAAVAVELVHNFSLLHDDIVNGDTERRHRPTAWSVFGVGAAILAGDALLALAQDLLLEDDAPQGVWAARCLSAAVQRLMVGQGADLAFQKRDEVTLVECLEAAGDKTAGLIACACSIGAVYLGAPPKLAMALAGFGAHVGLAFQLTDDLLGIWGAPEITGKPVRADLRARKKSLPVVAALNSGAPEAVGLRALLTKPEPLTEKDLIRAADLVVAAGGRDWAESESDAQLAEAKASLADVDLAADVRAEFIAIAEFITGRRETPPTALLPPGLLT